MIDGRVHFILKHRGGRLLQFTLFALYCCGMGSATTDYGVYDDRRASPFYFEA